MIKPSKAQLQALFLFLEGQSRDFRPGCRWLALGPEMAGTLLADFAQAPDLDELLDLVRLVDRQAPELIETVGWLVAASPHAESLRDEVQLDQLLAWDPDGWQHPVQILPKPRSVFADLLKACRRRLGMASVEARERLLRVEKKLLWAEQLEERARRRRREYRRQQEVARLRLERLEESDEEVH